MEEEMFEKLCEGIEQAIEHAKGERECRTFYYPDPESEDKSNDEETDTS